MTQFLSDNPYTSYITYVTYFRYVFIPLIGVICGILYLKGYTNKDYMLHLSALKLYKKYKKDILKNRQIYNGFVEYFENYNKYIGWKNIADLNAKTARISEFIKCLKSNPKVFELYFSKDKFRYKYEYEELCKELSQEVPQELSQQHLAPATIKDNQNQTTKILVFDNYINLEGEKKERLLDKISDYLNLDKKGKDVAIMIIVLKKKNYLIQPKSKAELYRLLNSKYGNGVANFIGTDKSINNYMNEDSFNEDEIKNTTELFNVD